MIKNTFSHDVWLSLFSLVKQLFKYLSLFCTGSFDNLITGSKKTFICSLKKSFSHIWWFVFFFQYVTYFYSLINAFHRPKINLLGSSIHGKHVSLFHWYFCMWMLSDPASFFAKTLLFSWVAFEPLVGYI